MNEAKLREILKEFMGKVAGILATLPKAEAAAPEKEASGGLSTRTLVELVSHEAIVKEAYKDSVGVWTWGVGVTSRSGHSVERYKDNPQPVSKVIEIFKWLVESKYLPSVPSAFQGCELSEEQLAAAVSFHYNTGAIGRASWVRSFKAGNIAQAKREFMQWKNPPEIVPRRQKERDLFFDGKWSNDGKVTIYERVRKPSYSPVWGSAVRVDITKELG